MASTSPTCEAIIIMAKLITLPMPSAIASASSQPPALADRRAREQHHEDREKRHHGQPAQRQQPGGADHAGRGQLQMSR